MVEEFIDGETGFKNKDKIDYKYMIASQLNAIAVISRQEYHGGYWQEKGSFTIGREVVMLREYVQDTREQYSNSVECLYDIMRPHIDAQMYEAANAIYIKIDTITLNFEKSKKTDTDKVTARSEKRLLMRLLFKELNKFLGRKKYFDNVQSNRE